MTNFVFYITEDVPGRNELWVIGDNFTAISYQKHFKYFMQQKDTTMYCPDNFEVRGYCNNRYNSNNNNILARLQNTVAGALNKNTWLPKYLAIVLDDDLIKYLDSYRVGISSMYRMWIEWLVQQVHELIKQKSAKLLTKAKSEICVYWVQAPLHLAFGEDNKRRMHFNFCLDAIIKGFDYMRIVKLKDHWSNSDAGLVKNRSFTEDGYDMYWKSFDSTMHFNITKREAFVLKGLHTAQKRKIEDSDRLHFHPNGLI